MLAQQDWCPFNVRRYLRALDNRNGINVPIDPRLPSDPNSAYMNKTELTRKSSTKSHFYHVQFSDFPPYNN